MTQRSGPWAVAPAAIVYLLVLFGLVQTPVGVRSDRPYQSIRAIPEQREAWVNARTWEDPLEATDALKYIPVEEPKAKPRLEEEVKDLAHQVSVLTTALEKAVSPAPSGEAHSSPSLDKGVKVTNADASSKSEAPKVSGSKSQPSLPKPKGDRVSVATQVAATADAAIPLGAKLQKIGDSEQAAPSSDGRTTAVQSTGANTNTANAETQPEAKVDNRLSPDGLTLAILLRGRPYEEDREWRLRMRYAVEAALAAENYTPDQNERISYRDIRFEKIFPEGGSQPWCLRVPMETFSPIEGRDEKQIKIVRILWINIDLFDTSPLSRLSLLLGSLYKSIPDTVVLGPPSSNWLLSMIREDRLFEETNNQSSGGDGHSTMGKALDNLKSALKTGQSATRLRIYSPFASLDLTTIAAPKGEEKNARSWFDQRSKGELEIQLRPDVFRWSLRRTTPHDGKTAELLVSELKQRTLMPGEPDPLYGGKRQLVLLAEQGTAFSEAFIKSVQAQSTDKKSIQVFRFLRGLDGQLPAQRTTVDGPAGQAPAPRPTPANGTDLAKANASNGRRFEQPNGRLQLDYVERLADDLARRNFEQIRDGKGPIRAVGIIATDVYDKLVLLRALRSRLDRAAFFTTDLEAELIHPANTVFTRNLLVASGYGLSAWTKSSAPDLPEAKYNQAPFREGGQTALYCSVIDALGHPLGELKNADSTPLLYEIGLRRSHLLSCKPDQSSVTSAQKATLEPKASQSENGMGRRVLVPSVALIMLLAVVLAFLKVQSRARVPAAPADAEHTVVVCSGMENKTKRKGKFFGWGLSVLVAPAILLGVFSLVSSELKDHWRALHWPLACVLACLLALSPSNRKSWGKKLCMAVAIPLVIWFYCYISNRINFPGEEAIVWWDGVSVWPGIFLRLVVVLLGLFFLWRADRQLRGNWSLVEMLFFRDWLHEDAPARKFPRRAGAARLTFDFFKEDGQGNERDAWWEYTHKARLWGWQSAPRWLGWALIILMASGLVMILVGFPDADTRGSLARRWEPWSLALALTVVAISVAFTVDQLEQCRYFIQRISDMGREPYGLELEETVQLIARTTEPVGNLVFYPFTLVFVLACAHFPHVEHWWGHESLCIILASLLVVVVVASILLQMTAGRLRERAIDFTGIVLGDALAAKRMALQKRGDLACVEWKIEGGHEGWWQLAMERLGRRHVPPIQMCSATDICASPDPKNSSTQDPVQVDVDLQNARIQRCETLIRMLGDLRHGAFRPLHENPIFQAVLIPAGGLGSLNLIEYFLK